MRRLFSFCFAGETLGVRLFPLVLVPEPPELISVFFQWGARVWAAKTWTWVAEEGGYWTSDEKADIIQ